LDVRREADGFPDSSFNLLGGGFKSNPDFPSGLSPLLVQQGFSHVLLQNLFDLQRRAGYSLLARNEGTGESIVVNGLLESDCNAVLELLLNSLVRPNELDRRVDVIGKRCARARLLFARGLSFSPATGAGSATRR
jgi:hypothetical protein